ncbi:MAG: hypothetical protein M8467_04125 [Anaerolineae bacterium]|nr:hypothetical protein [Anaerolineae bacterium]
MRKTTATALLTFFILSLVLTNPLALHLAGSVEDRQDALLNVWITAWDGHQLLNDPVHLFDANIFHPYPRTLAYSELLLGNALLALPLTTITGNPVFGYNVALFLSFFLSGFGAYLLALRLTRSHGAGLVAGTIFAFSAYRLTNLAQAQLLITQWMPLALVALYGLTRRANARSVAIFVLFFCLQALSSFYYAILLTLALAGYVAWDTTNWLIGRFAPRAASVPRRLAPESAPPATRRPPFGHLIVAALLCGLLILPFALPYFRVQRELGFERTLAESEPFSASLLQYAMVPPNSLLYAGWLPSDDTPITGGYPVDALFPGLVAVLLATWGLVRGRGSLRWFFFVLALVALVLSLGPRLYLAPGQPAGWQAQLPYAWLYALLPGFKALRAPVRFDVLVTLSLAVLAGYGLAALTAKQLSGRRSHLAHTVVPLLVVGLLALKSLVWPAAQGEPVPVGDAVPPVYRWLAEQPPEPVLELPMAFTPGGPQLEYQYFSTYHWQTTPDGYSGFVPPKHGQIVYEMERFPSERSVSLLQALGVRRILVHSNRYPAERWAALQATLGQADELELVEAFGADQVYEVRPRPFAPDELEVYAYMPPQARAGEPYTAYAIARNLGARSYAVQPTAQAQPSFEWRGPAAPIGGEPLADVPLVISPDGGAAVIPLSFAAPADPGSYELSIAENGGLLGSWSSTGKVLVGDGAGIDFPVPASLVDWRVPQAAAPGEVLQVDLVWRALGKIDAYYSVYVKLLDAEGNVVTSWDGQPRDGQAPTLLWVPGEHIDDVVSLAVPGDLGPGDYGLVTGMYRAEDLAGCLTLDAAGRPVAEIFLGTIRVGTQ